VAQLFGDGGVAEMAEALNIPLLGRIPIEPGVTLGGDQGQPFVSALPESAAAKAMERATGNLLQILEKLKPAPFFNFEWHDLSWDERHPQPPADGKDLDGPVRAVWQVSLDELGIQWRDGEVALFPVRELRLQCPCAACVDEWSGERTLDPDSIASDISLKRVTSVGRYAISPEFSDGHRSGIFHFDRLRKMAAARG
jgi:ATP-binding protein involved in chromosome partitioning